MTRSSAIDATASHLISPARRIAVEGVISLLLTPFHLDRSIDLAAYDAYVDWQLAQGPAGLFAVCGSSEMKWLDVEERLELARRAVAQSGDVPVFATANLGPDPAGHAQEIELIAATGVTAVVLIPQPALARDAVRYAEYLLALVEGAPVPVLLYEWPQIDDYLLDVAVVSAVAHAVSGIKDTTCTLEGIGDKLRVADDTVIYQANLPFLVDSLRMGARGIMAVVSTACADQLVGLWDSFRSGSGDLHRRHRELVMLDGLLRQSYPASAKYVVAKRGIPMPLTTRWPAPLSAETARALDVWLDNRDD